MDTSILSVLSIFMLQLGSRNLMFEATDAQKRMFRHPGLQTIILACMFFVSTRHIAISILLAVSYVAFVYVLANEKHPYNVLPKTWLQKEGFIEEKIASSVTSVKETYKENLAKLY